MAGGTGATAPLRRLWLLAGALLVVGVAVPGGGGVLAAPGLFVLAVAGGVTAARGRSSGRLLALAWAVPVVPSLALVALTAWLVVAGADPLAVGLFTALAGALVVGTWAVFLVALLVEAARGRRRFGAARPAWKNDPTPPSYS